MTRKQLAEMIKELRRQKLEEIIGKPFPFEPAHRKGTHGEDPQSPNQYLHVMKEHQARARRTSSMQATKMPSGRGGVIGQGSHPLSGRDVLDRYRLSSRVVEETDENKKMVPSKRKYLGRQRMKGRYDEEAHVEFKGGKTDTGQSSDVIDVSPKDKNSVNKEISITKENKEK